MMALVGDSPDQRRFVSPYPTALRSSLSLRNAAAEIWRRRGYFRPAELHRFAVRLGLEPGTISVLIPEDASEQDMTIVRSL